MKRFDQGLGVMGLLALVVTLAVLLSVSLPIIKSDATLRVSDWLGFAGNMIAAVLAAVAAAVAWIAAQRQIRHAALQNSIIAYNAIRDLIAGIDRDAAANTKIGIALMVIRSQFEDHDLDEQLVLALRRKEIEAQLEQVGEGVADLSDFTSMPWGGPSERKTRAELIEAAQSYCAFSAARLAMTYEDASALGFKKSFVDNLWADSERLSNELSRVIANERARMYALLDGHFTQFTKLG